VGRDNVLEDGANACLIGNEILQFRTATLGSPGIYTLSGLLRGRRGTESLMTGHVALERFTLLQMAGLRRVGMETGDIGGVRYFRAVTIGRTLASSVNQSLTFQSIGAKPFSPVDIRGTRASNDLNITWYPRTRLATNFNNSLAPLGEVTELYIVEIYSNSGFTTVFRTITGITSRSTIYTSAQQIADFGSNQATVHCRVYQVSATFGRGYYGQASI